MYVVTPKEMREMDNRAIEVFGIPSIVLMENAALRTIDFIEEEYTSLYEGGKVLVLVGCGNNGGDGLAIARHLMLRGMDVKVILLFPEDDLSGDVKLNLNIYKRLGGHIEIITHESHMTVLDEAIAHTNLIVDSIFGTGLTRDIGGHIYSVIEKINEKDKPVVAVDIPSGINGDNGQIMGIGIKASHTVSFEFAKRGHLLYPGRGYTGKTRVVKIGLPTDSGTAIGAKAFTLDDKAISSYLKRRPADGHKGTFGKVGVIAGSVGMTGAAYLTSMAALRSGAGLVTLGCPASLNSILEKKTTEAMTYPLEDGGKGHLNSGAISQLEDFLKDKDVLAIGPGLGQKCDGSEIIRYILTHFDISIVMDADALNHISTDKELLKSYKGSIVVTPHPGEMARLTGKTIEEILQSPIDVGRSLAKELDIFVLLKGATTVVAHPSGRVYLNSSGNSGMGTGGSGDVLTGMIGSLVAQGYSPYDAAVYGSYIHGRAGDYAKDKWGEIGMLAGDILNELPLVFKDIYSLKN
ncbi:MAG TPA: NAD(P)H-hydrate dehydratase [Clostridia bacterium]|nr:NAD(P)H-hydrate dehydratase [Clostridia bacterium]